jgi:hypothetical protein
MRFEVIGELSNRFAGDAGVVVQTQNVLAFGHAQSDVKRLGKAEVAGQTAEPDGGELIFDRGTVVARAVVDNDDLMGFAECFEAPAKGAGAIERNNNDRYARRLRRSWFDGRSQSAILL